MESVVQAFLIALERDGLRKNSIEAYGRDIKQLQEFMLARGLEAWERMEAHHLEAFIKSLEQASRSAATITRQVAAVRRFVKFLQTRGITLTEEFNFKQKTKVDRKSVLVLSKAEIQHLLDQQDLKSETGIRDFLMIKMLYETGIRVSELIALKVGHVDFKRKRILCETVYEQRMVYLNHDLVKRLKRYLSFRNISLEASEAPLFANCYGKQLSRQGLWKIVKYYAEASGLNSAVTPHTLRHSFAVHLLQDGGNIKHLQLMMGHQDLTSTQFYEDYISRASRLDVDDESII